MVEANAGRLLPPDDPNVIYPGQAFQIPTPPPRPDRSPTTAYSASEPLADRVAWDSSSALTEPSLTDADSANGAANATVSVGPAAVTAAAPRPVPASDAATKAPIQTDDTEASKSDDLVEVEPTLPFEPAAENELLIVVADFGEPVENKALPHREIANALDQAFRWLRPSRCMEWHLAKARVTD